MPTAILIANPISLSRHAESTDVHERVPGGAATGLLRGGGDDDRHGRGAEPRAAPAGRARATVKERRKEGRNREERKRGRKEGRSSPLTAHGQPRNSRRPFRSLPPPSGFESCSEDTVSSAAPVNLRRAARHMVAGRAREGR